MTRIVNILRRGSTQLMLAGLVAAAAGTFTAAVQAAPADGPMHPMGMMAGGMPGGGPGGGFGAGPGWGGHLGPRMLDAINATADQRTQIQQIMTTARNDLSAQREAGRSLRDQMRQAFTQATVDANVVEALRKQALAVHDQVSKRMTQAMLDVSRVLTPEQRAQLAQLMAQRRGMMERWAGERGGPARATK